jgi:hypothetical protein
VQVGVAEDAGGDGAGAVAQLDGEVGRTGAGRQPVLAGAGEDAAHVVAGTQRGDGRGGVEPGGEHAGMMYRDPDAAARLGEPS